MRLSLALLRLSLTLLRLSLTLLRLSLTLLRRGLALLRLSLTLLRLSLTLLRLSLTLLRCGLALLRLSLALRLFAMLRHWLTLHCLSMLRCRSTWALGIGLMLEGLGMLRRLRNLRMGSLIRRTMRRLLSLGRSRTNHTCPAHNTGTWRCGNRRRTVIDTRQLITIGASLLLMLFLHAGRRHMWRCRKLPLF